MSNNTEQDAINLKNFAKFPINSQVVIESRLTFGPPPTLGTVVGHYFDKEGKLRLTVSVVKYRSSGFGSTAPEKSFKEPILAAFDPEHGSYSVRKIE